MSNAKGTFEEKFKKLALVIIGELIAKGQIAKEYKGQIQIIIGDVSPPSQKDTCLNGLKPMSFIINSSTKELENSEDASVKIPSMPTLVI